MTQTPTSDAELDALLALLSAKPDAPEKIAAFLRTAKPIGPMLRDALAMALTSETASGSRLELIPGARLANENRSKVAAKKRMEIGRWMRAQIAGGMSRTGEGGAIAKAAIEFAVSEKAADAALIYYDEAQRWIEGQRAFSARHNADWNDAYLLSAFHHHKRVQKQFAREDRDMTIGGEL